MFSDSLSSTGLSQEQRTSGSRKEGRPRRPGVRLDRWSFSVTTICLFQASNTTAGSHALGAGSHSSYEERSSPNSRPFPPCLASLNTVVSKAKPYQVILSPTAATSWIPQLPVRPYATVRNVVDYSHALCGRKARVPDWRAACTAYHSVYIASVLV